MDTTSSTSGRRSAWRWRIPGGSRLTPTRGILRIRITVKASGIHISGALLMPITHGHVPWQSTDMTTYARSSAGRAAVSKTRRSLDRSQPRMPRLAYRRGPTGHRSDCEGVVITDQQAGPPRIRTPPKPPTPHTGGKPHGQQGRLRPIPEWSSPPQMQSPTHRSRRANTNLPTLRQTHRPHTQNPTPTQLRTR